MNHEEMDKTIANVLENIRQGYLTHNEAVNEYVKCMVANHFRLKTEDLIYSRKTIAVLARMICYYTLKTVLGNQISYEEIGKFYHMGKGNVHKHVKDMKSYKDSSIYPEYFKLVERIIAGINNNLIDAYRNI